MTRVIIYVLALLAVSLAHAVTILDLPATLDAAYDLRCTLTVTGALKAPISFTVEATPSHAGYRLTVTETQATWTDLGTPAAFAPVTAPLALPVHTPVTLTLKRRPDTVAVVCNHRRVLLAPAPSLPQGTLRLEPLPAQVALDEVRYQPIDAPRLGDDFMRPEGLQRFLTASQEWGEDDTWHVAYYRKDDPGEDPVDPETDVDLLNPWQLSLFEVAKTSVNGFWFTYTGVGPSWVVAVPTRCYPSWDQYALQAAIKPEYDSEVGLLVAYQDNQNYVRFCWRPEAATTPAAPPRAELVAVLDGQPQVLATALTGFLPDQWYRVRVNCGWEQLEVWVDGACLLSAPNPGLLEGRVGLYASGAAHPHRTTLDATTATMYQVTDPKTGKVYNDAADALRTTSCVYFDDIRVTPWAATEQLLAGTRFAVQTPGAWEATPEGLTATGAGLRVVAHAVPPATVLTAQLTVPGGGRGGLLLRMSPAGDGLLWEMGPTGQALRPLVRGQLQPALATTPQGVATGVRTPVRVVLAGTTTTCWVNDQPVLVSDRPDDGAGWCGVWATKAGVSVSPMRLRPYEREEETAIFHDGFPADKWLITWASREADWYPAFTPKAYVTPAGFSHDTIGRSAPLPTDAPGLYWHKGGHYGDLSVTVPVTPQALAGQRVHLTTDYQAEQGYQLVLQAEGTRGRATLRRLGQPVVTGTFALSPQQRVCLDRRGGVWRVHAQSLVLQEGDAPPVVTQTQRVFTYQDAAALPADQVGFTVTDPKLPAAAVQVVSDRREETFERSPVGWMAQQGVWAIMNRYSCQPWWNWFGGFGAGIPAVWSKYRLDGDQVVEAYLGVKMQYDNMPEEEARRFRDLNLTICGKAGQPNSGYTLQYSARVDGKPVTQLLRQGVVVAASDAPEHLLPLNSMAGHRKWYALRLEKRGANVLAFLDNRLVFRYCDPDALAGGYTTCWTTNNGIMIGRVNLAAARMTLLGPAESRALVQAPPAVEEVP